MNTLSIQFVDGSRYTEQQLHSAVSMTRLSEICDAHDNDIATVWLEDEAGNLLDKIVGDDLIERELDEDDGQPDEYTEWQDYMGGDDWDHGQYDY